MALNIEANVIAGKSVTSSRYIFKNIISIRSRQIINRHIFNTFVIIHYSVVILFVGVTQLIAQ